MSQQINEILNNLVDAIKRNQIEEASVIYNQLEELVGEIAAEDFFNKIEIILLEDWFMCITGTFILLLIIFVGVSDYIEIQSRVIKNKLKKKVKNSCVNCTAY